MINGECIGKAYSKYIWLYHHDFTTNDYKSMHCASSVREISTIQCIHGYLNLIIYSSY
jgi:hypothetical protein